MREIKRDIVGAFIFSHDGKLLLGKSIDGGVYPDCWMVPGGGVRQGESFIDAVKREVIEETGIDITGADVVPSGFTQQGSSQKTLRESGEKVMVLMSFNDHIVRLKKNSSEVNIIDGDDFKDSRWFDIEDLPKLNLAPPGIKSLKAMGLLK